MTVETGHFDVLRRSFATVSDDQRIQAMHHRVLLRRAAGGAGRVRHAGRDHLRHADRAGLPAAEGRRPSRWSPTPRRSRSARWPCRSPRWPPSPALPQDDLGAMVGRQTPIARRLRAAVPGLHRRRQARHPQTLAGGAARAASSFGVAQFIASNYISVPLTDIVASLASAGAVVLLLRVWQPADAYVDTDDDEPVAGRGGVATAERTGARRHHHRRTGGDDAPGPARRAGRRDRGRARAGPAGHPREIWRAYAPYLIIIAVFVDRAAAAASSRRSPRRTNDLPLAGAAHHQRQRQAVHDPELHASTGWPRPARCCSSPA